MILAGRQFWLRGAVWVLGCLLFFSSCSKLSRGRRLLSSSRKAYDQARTCLISGDVSKAKEFASRSVQLSEKAEDLLRATPLKDAAAGDVKRSQVLRSAFDGPEGAIRLWFQTTVERDRDLNAYIFDLSDLFDVVCGAAGEQQLNSERERLRTALLQSYQRTLGTYEDVLSNWEPRNVVTEIEGEHASLQCTFEMANVKNELSIYLRNTDGIWRAHDFATRGGKATEMATRLLGMVGDGVDLVSFFDGRGLFEALAQVEEIQRFDGLFNERPLIGCYVRTTEDVKLLRGETDECVECGRILKIIDQNWAGSEPGAIMVRTTEADPRESAVGRISLEVAKVVGTDESELWGVAF